MLGDDRRGEALGNILLNVRRCHHKDSITEKGCLPGYVQGWEDISGIENISRNVSETLDVAVYCCYNQVVSFR